MLTIIISLSYRRENDGRGIRREEEEEREKRNCTK
jgi:hypothetical protein